MNDLRFEDLAQGALNEQYCIKLQEILENINDPNTSATKARKMTIEFTFKPYGKDRELVDIQGVIKLLLAPITPIETKLLLDYDAKEKRVVASEWGNQMKGQLSLDDDLPDNVTTLNRTKSN